MSFFHFKHFSVFQEGNVHKVGTDAMLLGAFLHHESPKFILDIGAGTGVLSLIAGHRFPNATIKSVEKEAAAFALLEKNIQQSPFYRNIFPVNCSIADFSHHGQFDLIISNPPFFSHSWQAPNATRNTARHTAELSIADWLNLAAVHLAKNGVFWFVFPADRDAEIQQISLEIGWSPVAKIAIYGKPHALIRYIYAFSLVKMVREIRTESLTIRDENGKYTENYKILTKDLHQDIGTL